MPELDTVSLHGMRFHTLIGVLPHEREHPQPLEIDLTASVEPGAPVVDYRGLYVKVREAAESPALFHIEELADSIAWRVLEDASIRHVRVTVRKPHAAVGGPISHAQVSIARERNA